jgi:hypothetical protein
MESQIESPKKIEPSLFGSAIGIIGANRRPYIVINIVYYGLVLCAMIVAALYPALQHTLLASLQAQFQTNSLLAKVAKVYTSGNIPLAALVTFLVNSVLGAFASITLPSALIPFSGFLVGSYRPVIWGLLLSPTSHKLQLAMLPHSLTLLLEGQGYILAMFGSYLWGKWFLQPDKAGFATRKEGYLAGLRANVQLYSLILAVLAVAAVYEAIEVIAIAKVLVR